MKRIITLFAVLGTVLALAPAAQAAAVVLTDSDQLNLAGREVLAAVNLYDPTPGDRNHPTVGTVQGVDFDDFNTTVDDTGLPILLLAGPAGATLSTVIIQGDGREFGNDPSSLNFTGPDATEAEKLAHGAGARFQNAETATLTFDFGGSYANTEVEVQMLGGGVWNRADRKGKLVMSVDNVELGELIDRGTPDLLTFSATTDNSGGLVIDVVNTRVDPNDAGDRQWTMLSGITVTAPGSIKKSVSETAVNLDLGLTNLTYTIDILNATTTTLGGVVVTDALPAEVSFVSSIPPASMTNNNDYIFDIGNLEPGSNAVIQIVVTVTSTVPGVITNVAMFSATNTNVIVTAQATAETLLYRPADLDITKALSSVRSNLNYTITVTNRGAGIAEDVMVFDTLPADTIFDSSTPAPAGVSGSDYTFNLGALAPGVASSIVFSLVYTSALPATVTNTASTTTTSTETNSTNNTFTLISLIGQGVELALSKTVNPTNLLSGATNLTYTITVDNIGTTSAVSVVVTDSLPAGVTFLMAVPAASQTNGNELTFDLGSIAFGGGTSIVIDAVYTAGLVGITLTNWATVYTPTQELSLINNRDSATTVILDPLVDTDGDGMSDCAEIIAGTDPSDPTSYLWITIVKTPDHFARQLTFPSVVTRTYHIQSSTNFNTGPWVNVQTNIPGIDALINSFRTNLLDKLYYRIGVEQP